MTDELPPSESENLPSTMVERTLLRRLVNNIPDEPARRRIAWLSIPHFFDDAVLNKLDSSSFVEGVAGLERSGLIERWPDGSRAVLDPVRRLLLEEIARTTPTQYAELSGAFGDIFQDIAENAGDVFHHVESVYHRLVAEPQRGTDLLLADGMAWKSEPLFAFEALGRLVEVAEELRERGVLTEDARAILQLLELYLPGRRKTAFEEVQILQPLLKGALQQNRLFQGELRLRLGLAKLQLGQTAAARELFYSALYYFEAMAFRRGVGDAVRALGRLALREDKLEEAQEQFERSRKIFEQLKLKGSAAHCIKSLAETAFYQGRFAAAEKLFGEALEGFAATQGHLGEANTRVVYSQLLTARGQFASAGKHLQLATSIYEEIDQQLGIGNCLKNKGVLLFEEKLYAEALKTFSLAREHYERCSSVMGQANCTLWTAACMIRLGQPRAALPLLDDAENIFQRIGERFGFAGVLRERGFAEMLLGMPVRAIASLDQAVRLFSAVGNDVEAQAAWIVLGRAALAAGLPAPYTIVTLRQTAIVARRRFQQIGFTRHLREADELLLLLDAKQRRRFLGKIFAGAAMAFGTISVVFAFLVAIPSLQQFLAPANPLRSLEALAVYLGRLKMNNVVRLAFVLFVAVPTAVFAACPIPLPDRPTASDLRDCINEIGELKKTINEIAKTPPPQFYVSEQPTESLPEGGIFRAWCDGSDQAVAGVCEVKIPAKTPSGANEIHSLQNSSYESGPQRSGWSCVWNPRPVAASVRPVCLRSRAR